MWNTKEEITGEKREREIERAKGEVRKEGRDWEVDIKVKGEGGRI